MNIDFLKVNNEIKLEQYKNKLLADMMSLKEKLEQEIESMDKDYKPSNPLGVIGERGNAIDNLIGKIATLQELQEQLNNI